MSARLSNFVFGKTLHSELLWTHAKLPSLIPATWQLDDGAWGRAPLHTFEGSQGGRVSVWLHWATYDRACLAALGTPHCAIALNAGLGVVTYRWADAIEILSAARTPFIVTDYYEAGLWIGCQLPAVKRSLELTYPITLNPFRQPLVWPEATGRATSMPWMCNGFICGFHTEPSAEAMLHDGVAVEGVTAATGVGAAQESSLVMGVVAASELGVSAGEALAGEKEAQEASGKVAVAGEMTKPQLEPRLAREVLEAPVHEERPPNLTRVLAMSTYEYFVQMMCTAAEAQGCARPSSSSQAFGKAATSCHGGGVGEGLVDADDDFP